MMGAMKVSFLKSGTNPTEYPFPYKPEIAVVGRSNAGKSSFLNALFNQKAARVSATPGKTRLLNFFQLGEKLYLVDMPGYGFATGNRREVAGWQKMIETYLKERETLCGVVLVMDIRRDWSEQERQLKEWFEHFETPWAVILNKSDKLSRSQIAARKRAIQGEIGGDVPVFAVSSAKKHGLDEVKNLLLKEWPQ